MSYIPNISGFVDFCSYHANGEPIYIVNGSLYASFDMRCRIDDRYNFIGSKSKAEVEQAIKDNSYMFGEEETNRFYCPNDNMFSMSNAQYHIKGKILTLKRQYTDNVAYPTI